ncbi:MAG: ribonuclease P protein component [Simplicispira sp.]|nr:ribonuclease P protein component [Simplicispira sp.]
MQRLRTRAQFQAAMAGGTVARTAHFALHRLALDASNAALLPLAHTDGAAPAHPPQPLFSAADVWLGAMVPKRWARRAVTRNTIKRQIYSVAMGLDSPLLVAAHVVRLRSTFDRKHFVSATSEALKEAVRAELLQLFARAAPRSNLPPEGRP